MAEPVTATATETMAHFPLMIELADRAVVVIGGGQVAARKVSTIVEYGAAVTVIAPELHPDLLALVQAGRISHRSRPYQEGDLSGFPLVLAAPDDAEINRLVHAEALSLGVPVNTADRPDLCTFYMPATVRRGELLVAISTGGACPALARALRERLETEFLPEGSERLVAAMTLLRKTLLTTSGYEERSRLLRELAADRKLTGALMAGNLAAAEHLLEERTGLVFDLSELELSSCNLSSKEEA